MAVRHRFTVPVFGKINDYFAIADSPVTWLRRKKPASGRFI